MAVPPRAMRLLRRVRRLRGDVGDPQPGADAGTDPVRRLVVEVVREPAPRRPGRAQPAIEQPLHLCPPDTRQPALAGSVAGTVERPQPRRQCHFVAGPLQRAHQQPGDESITRRGRVIRRLERRVERNPHNPGSWMVAAPEPGAGRARRPSIRVYFVHPLVVPYRSGPILRRRIAGNGCLYMVRGQDISEQSAGSSGSCAGFRRAPPPATR